MIDIYIIQKQNHFSSYYHIMIHNKFNLNFKILMVQLLLLSSLLLILDIMHILNIIHLHQTFNIHHKSNLHQVLFQLNNIFNELIYCIQNKKLLNYHLCSLHHYKLNIMHHLNLVINVFHHPKFFYLSLRLQYFIHLLIHQLIFSFLFFQYIIFPTLLNLQYLLKDYSIDQFLRIILMQVLVLKMYLMFLHLFQQFFQAQS